MKTCWFFCCIVLIYFIAGCAHIPQQRYSPDTRIAGFNKVWMLVQEHYPYLGYKRINWAKTYNRFRPKVENVSEDEYIDALSNMLGTLRDRHVYIKTKHGELITPYISPQFENSHNLFSLDVISDYMPSLRCTPNGNFYYSIMPDNTCYLYIPTFYTNTFMHDFFTIQEKVAQTNGLIIDIRNNVGGYCTNVYRLVSWLLEEPLEHPPIYRNGIQQESHPIPAYNPSPYDKPIILMTNGVCYSSSDLFALLMKQLPHVTAIGDTTGGGSSGANRHVPGNYTLPGGYTLHISTLDFRDYDNKPWEEVGIAPDILVEQSIEALHRGVDNQFEYAKQFLKDALQGNSITRKQHGRISS